MSHDSLKAMVATLFVGMGLIVLAIVTHETDSTKKRDVAVFEDMAKAREYQRKCLAKGNSALVKTNATGITITCIEENQ